MGDEVGPGPGALLDTCFRKTGRGRTFKLAIEWKRKTNRDHVNIRLYL